MNYNFLYAFTGQEFSLVEIKRTDLPEGSPVGIVYHWLLIQGSQVTKLTFKSMEKGEIEKREFVEGKLQFTRKNATYNGIHLDSFVPTEKIKSLISAYLIELDKA